MDSETVMNLLVCPPNILETVIFLYQYLKPAIRGFLVHRIEGTSR